MLCCPVLTLTSPQATRTENSVKFARVVYEICKRTHRHTYCNTSHPYGGGGRRQSMNKDKPARRAASRRTCCKQITWTLSVINLRPSYVDNASRSKVADFQLPHLHLTYPRLHLAHPLAVSPFEFCRDFRHQKTRVAGLLCGVVYVILRLAVSVEHQLVTDGQTDTQRQLIPALGLLF